MSLRFRRTLIGLLSAALVVVFSPNPALARGGGGGFGGGGFSGAHVSGFGGGNYGGWSGGHVSSFAPSHVSAWSGSHVGTWAGHTAYSPVYHGFNSVAARTPNWNRAALAVNHGAWNHAWNAGVWNHDRTWWGHNEPYRNNFYRFGLFGWPWYGLGLGYAAGYGSWWPYYYGYGPYGDTYGGYYDVGVAPYTPYADYTEAAPDVASTSVSPDVEETQPEANAVEERNNEGFDFYTQALAAFREGEYGNATRLAGHAAIDEPRNSDVHVLAMLGLLGMGEYRGAAIEAHIVAALGNVPDWPKLFSFYENVSPYTEQLRKLEKFVGEHPSAPEGRFLLGFQYLMMGHKDAAKTQLAESVKLTPRDALAVKLFEKEGGIAPSGASPRGITAQKTVPPAASPSLK